jgi:inhibitor of KinA sporulation pathway (predicted exonuclease)
MGIKLDLINVIDVEATCWKGTKPENQESEIIEIGICTLDVATGNRVDNEGILVKPERSFYSQSVLYRINHSNRSKINRGNYF